MDPCQLAPESWVGFRDDVDFELVLCEWLLQFLTSYWSNLTPQIGPNNSASQIMNKIVKIVC